MNSCRSYSTKQRSVILDKMMLNKNHQYTAEELLHTLKNDNTPVGKATLYRYLDHLVQTGEVKKFFKNNKRTIRLFSVAALSLVGIIVVASIKPKTKESSDEV